MHSFALPWRVGLANKELQMTCPICNIANLVTINMTVNDRALTLHSCARCETRWWDRDGEHVALRSVLETAKVQRTA
jgi:Zn-finger nucleic acid-binding protein